MNYLKYLVEEIHTTVVATVDDAGLPVTAAIDMMDYDEGSGEWFDLSKKPIERASFTFGGGEEVQDGYFVTDTCIGCKLCYSKCPQKCIDISGKPVVIQQQNCLHCGNCYEICPARAIVKRG